MPPMCMVSSEHDGAVYGVNKFKTISSLPAKISASWWGRTFASQARRWPWSPSVLNHQKLGYVTQIFPAFDQPIIQMRSVIKPIYCLSVMPHPAYFAKPAFGQHALEGWTNRTLKGFCLGCQNAADVDETAQIE